jgi:hypothetical protein
MAKCKNTKTDMYNKILLQVELSLVVIVSCARYDMIVVCDGVGGSCHFLLPAGLLCSQEICCVLA